MSAPEEEEKGFEEQLEQLEELVRSLESGELGLEHGVERYREGVALLKELNASLATAEQQVDVLTEALRQELAGLEADAERESEDG